MGINEVILIMLPVIIFLFGIFIFVPMLGFLDNYYYNKKQILELKIKLEKLKRKTK